MTAPNPAVRAIARGLLDALLPALEPGASGRERAVARDVAQVLGLDGLDAVLSELERTRNLARPADVAHVASRLSRLAERAAGEESAAPFHAADAELAALARALRETEWAPAGASAVAVYDASEVLADLPLEPGADLARARLSAPVAAALRAALEWIGADEALVVQAAVHDSALTLTCPAAHPGGLGPAGAVLGSVEGSLGPEPDGRWMLRVPLQVERPSFLLLRLGHIPVALPWHAVARLRMLPPAEWAHQAEPLLEPLTTLQPGPEERPGALVALGLARAWLVADRIVWRIALTPEDVASDHGPFGASTRAVSVENGERYWVLESGWLLRGVAPTAVATPAPRPRHAAPAPAPAELAPSPEAADEPWREQGALADAVARAIEALRGEREALAAVAVAPPSRELPLPGPPPPPAFVHAHLAVLRPGDVEPFDAPPAHDDPAEGPGAPASAAAVAPAPPSPVPPRVAAPVPARLSDTETLPGRRALVADDSLVARVFLARLLERRGYVVEAVGDGEGMWQQLARGPWALVCADVTMPDSHGRAHLERLLDFRASCREPFRLIALTRDAGEERDADLAGATLHLRKPFDPGALDDLLGT